MSAARSWGTPLKISMPSIKYLFQDYRKEVGCDYKYCVLLQVIPYLADGFQRAFFSFQPYVSICTTAGCQHLTCVTFLVQALYFSSALSLYFVYDFCLLSEAGPILMYLLRYIPFFLTVAITATMIALRQVQPSY